MVIITERWLNWMGVEELRNNEKKSYRGENDGLNILEYV
jgi:hypothetical protein